MAEIKTGWLKDYNGEKFAPITDARQVYFNGTKDENVQDILSKKPGKLVEGENFNGVIAGVGAEIFNDMSGNSATGFYSHAEGSSTIASATSSHAEGGFSQTKDNEPVIVDFSVFQYYASGCNHAEGLFSESSNVGSHSEGIYTKALGIGSHAAGCETIAAGNYQYVFGRNNISDENNTYIHIVGNGKGTTEANSSNAHTIDWDGNAWFSGDVYIKSTSGTNKDSGSKKLATEEYVDSNKSNIVIREW